MSGFNVNVQGMVDAMVADMQKTPSQRKLEAGVTKKFVSTLNKDIREDIQYHTEQIESLQAVTNGTKLNEKAIAYHSSMLDYYMS